jgi:hypothetical protein
MAGPSIPVQHSAYDTDALDPQWPGGGALTSEPRFGIYLLRLVADPRAAPGFRHGWQVIARLGR